MIDNEETRVNFRSAFYFATHTYDAKVRLLTPLCDVSRAAGGRTDGDWYHSSHQDVEPIHPTLRGGWFHCIMRTQFSLSKPS